MNANDLAALPYDEFCTALLAFFANLPPTPFASALPVGYTTGLRGWDTWMALKWGSFQPTDALLDTGAWLTFLALYLRQFVASVAATDSFKWAERDFARKARYTAADWILTIEHLGDVSACNMDLQAIERPDNTYDKITCISTIEHVIDDHRAMSEMVRVLKPGGRLLLTTEYDESRGKSYSEIDGSWYRVYTEETWDALLAPYKVLHREVSTMPHEHWFTVAFACVEKE